MEGKVNVDYVRLGFIEKERLSAFFAVILVSSIAWSREPQQRFKGRNHTLQLAVKEIVNLNSGAGGVPRT